MNFRQADIHDILPVTLLWVKMIGEVFDGIINLDKVEVDAFSFALCDRIRYENTFTSLAEDEGKIIGFIHGYEQDRPYGKPRKMAFCECLYLETEYRGKEIDQALIESFIEWGKEKDLSIEFMSPNSNKHLSYYEKFAKPYAVVYRID